MNNENQTDQKNKDIISSIQAIQILNEQMKVHYDAGMFSIANDVLLAMKNHIEVLHSDIQNIIESSKK